MYERVNWQNSPSTATPVSADNLNKMDKGIADIDSQLAQKANRDEVDVKLANFGSAKPSGAFPTLSDLTTTHPNGNGDNYYVVTEDNNWYYWNGTNWVSGGLFNATVSDDFPATNLIRNGNFSDGTSAWAGEGTITILENEAKFLASTQFGALRQTVYFEKNHVYYFQANVKATSTGVRLAIRPTPSTIAGDARYSGSGNYEKLSNIAKVETDTSFPSLAIVDNRTTGSDIFVKDVLCLDLTDIFGAGNEPDLYRMQEIMNMRVKSWFDGTVSPLVSNRLLYKLMNDVLAGETQVVKLEQNVEKVVEPFNSGELVVDVGWATQVVLHGTTDGINFKRLSVQSLDTGTEFNRIDLSGKYQVNLMGVQAIKYSVVNNGAESPTENISILLSRDKFVKLAKETPSIQYYPSALPQVEYMTEARKVTFLTSEGTSYYIDDKRIYKSNNYGTTINEISAGHSAWGNSAIEVQHVIKLDDGRLLVWVYYWEDEIEKMTIWRSDENEGNFTRKLSYPYEGNIHPGWRPFPYGGTIVYGEYYVGRTDELCRIKLSRDYGETWDAIYTAPVPASGKVWHFHDVTYDPYRSRIWVINGDYGENANVRYSDDFGKTWFELWEEGTSPVQFTTVHPMPDKVLFGTDSPLLRGMYVYKEGSSSGKYTLEPLKIWTETPQLGNATYRGNHLWNAGAVYFISVEQINANDQGYYVIWGTKDGHNLYRLWTSETLIGDKSLNYLSGPDTNGMMMAHFVNDGVAKNIKFNAPIWKRH